MSKATSVVGTWVDRLTTATSTALRRFAAPLAIGVLASLSMVGQAGLPAKRPGATPLTSTTHAVPQIKPAAAAQMAALNQIKAAKTANQRKIDSRLYMSLMQQRGDARLSALTHFRYARPEADGRFPVDITIRRGGDVKSVLQALAALDAPLLSPKRIAFSARTISTRVALKDLEALAALRSVSRIRQAIPAQTSALKTPGPVSVPASRSRIGRPVANALDRSEGVQAHGADQARATFGASGGGQMICALSDGIDSLAASQASGDLPADILVLPGQAGGGDEGTAMLEIIHDMAPSARLGFATAFNGEASFAQNILDLAAAGCTIIVDDVIYLDESPWQDGPVAQSVNAVTSDGVLYFSSAGNEGNANDGTSGTWEGDFALSATPPPPALAGVGALHDFGDGGVSLSVEGGNGNTPVILIWAEHYTLDEGFAGTDYDVYLLSDDLSTIFDASADIQDGSGNDDFPVEFVGGGAFTGDRIVVANFSGVTSSDPPFNLIVFRGEVDDALATSGATRGHSAAINAYSTAATPAAASFDGITADGPFPGLFTSVNESESFSSDGPRRILLDPFGSMLTPGDRSFATGGVVRQKPDITAADGVSTQAPGFATFYGTSAAAPHAAAIAGLLRAAVPSLATGQIRATLQNTAIDIELPGADRDTGFGIVMPLPTLTAAGATPQPFLAAGAAVVSQVFGDGDGAIEPNEVFSISLPLSNIGAVDATGISATLSTASGSVTVLDSVTTYADIAPAGSGSNATAFRFRVDPAFICGNNIAFTLNVAYNGNSSPQTFGLSKPTGSDGTPIAVSYGGPPVAIPDEPGPAVDAPLTVSGLLGAIRDVNMSIDGATCTAAVGATTVGIDHTFVSDLDVGLVAPDGRVVTLISGAGGGGNNFCQVALDDESAGPSIQTINGANAPFTGSYRPATALSAFDGGNGNGTWTLRVQDFAGIDTGSIRAWSLSVTPAICDAVAATPPTVSSVLRAASSPSNAASVSYTVTFSEAVSGVDVGDFALTTTGALPGAAVTSVSGSGASRTVVVGTGTGTGSGTLRLNVLDNDSIISTTSAASLGGGFVTGEVYAIDRAPPTATLAVASGQANPVATAPVRFSVSLSDSTADFDATDVSIGGTAAPTAAVVTGSGTAYEIAVSGMTANGTVTAQVNAAAFADAAGNASTASALVSTSFDGVVPTIGYTLAAQSVAEGGGATVTVTATLSTARLSAVSAPIAIGSASTATQGSDYTLAATTIDIPAGSTAGTVTVNVIGDAVEEPDETVVLTLGTPSGATVGTPATQTVTISNDDDTTPDPFSFAAVTGAAPGSTQTSAAITVAGINQPTAISIGTGGSYSINSGAFTSAAGTVMSGQTVTVQQTASSAFATASTVSLSIGGVSSAFSVTTRAGDAQANAFAFVDVIDAEPATPTASNAIVIGGIEVPVAISITGGEYSINNAAFTSATGTVSAGNSVVVRVTSSATELTAVSTTLSIGSGADQRSDIFTVTTRAAPSGGGSAGGALLGVLGLAALWRRRRALFG
ncbi:S8 family serine peptidase [Nevskia sp.]|uniref:S8 family serine peptidase n=1 Tax=Nevskia sp. TaxID=1929292 RepID=UPI0025E41B91|nr:S8 family serine peptidase [Nevskia sp.]